MVDLQLFSVQVSCRGYDKVKKASGAAVHEKIILSAKDKCMTGTETAVTRTAGAVAVAESKFDPTTADGQVSDRQTTTSRC